MIDLVALVGLFAELFPATKGWREPKVERVGHLDDMDREELVIALEPRGMNFNGLAKLGCVS